MIRTDFYAVLGITPSASAEEIRQAFRLRARQYHPDANPDDKRAAEQFKVVNEAYRVLSTPQLRAAYDQALRMLTPEEAAAGRMQVPTPLRSGASPTATRPVAGTWGVAGPHPTTMHDVVAPALAMQVTPAQRSIVAPRELTRFYLLAELGPTAAAAVLDPLPLDLALVIDRSSSMRGSKIFEVKRAVRNLLDILRMDDLLTLVFFDDRAEVLADGETISGRAGIENALDQLSVRGGTEIASGLAATLERMAKRRNRSHAASIVLLSDGRTYGDESKCLQYASRARDLGITITGLGMGTDWNRELLDQLAAVSGGSSDFIEQPEQLPEHFQNVILRLRATLACNMRLAFEPTAGVRIARATRVAPDIAEVFSATGALTSATTSGPVTVDLGAIAGRPDVETAAAVWELLLDPASIAPRDAFYTLGTFRAAYWAPRQNAGQVERLEQAVHLPVNTAGQPSTVDPDVRLALELITAFRLQTQADALKAAGKAGEAAAQMTTSALRLQHAGLAELAGEAQNAAQVLTASEGGIRETLRVKYGTKNVGGFHRLRNVLRFGQH
ncbi:MAG TPA: DnaJ domain-containing protein [Ktedonobacterales bacterium]|nr:DnaJ domain-containing protein [Ktedonobacterales bacterium]